MLAMLIFLTICQKPSLTFHWHILYFYFLDAVLFLVIFTSSVLTSSDLFLPLFSGFLRKKSYFKILLTSLNFVILYAHLLLNPRCIFECYSIGEWKIDPHCPGLLFRPSLWWSTLCVRWSHTFSRKCLLGRGLKGCMSHHWEGHTTVCRSHWLSSEPIGKG